MEYKKENKWPTPPVSRAVPKYFVNDTIVLLLSIDSGAGTVKFMGRFLHVNGGQSVTDIFFIAQASSTMESFEYFQKLFSGYQEELQDISTKGIFFGGKNLRIEVIHDHDLKVLYILTGNRGARSKFPCPFCRIPRQLLNKSYNELMNICHRLPYRSDIEDLRNKKNKDYQYGGTYNILEMYPKSENRAIGNIAPPILHIQLGIVNKIIEVFDLIVKEWELKNSWNDEQTSTAKIHLAK